MKNDLCEDLNGKCVTLHVLIPHKAQVIIIVEKTRGGESTLTFRVLKIMKVKMKDFYTYMR